MTRTTPADGSRPSTAEPGRVRPRGTHRRTAPAAAESALTRAERQNRRRARTRASRRARSGLARVETAELRKRAIARVQRDGFFVKPQRRRNKESAEFEERDNRRDERGRGRHQPRPACAGVGAKCTARSATTTILQVSPSTIDRPGYRGEQRRADERAPATACRSHETIRGGCRFRNGKPPVSPRHPPTSKKRLTGSGEPDECNISEGPLRSPSRLRSGRSTHAPRPASNPERTSDRAAPPGQQRCALSRRRATPATTTQPRRASAADAHPPDQRRRRAARPQGGS